MQHPETKHGPYLGLRGSNPNSEGTYSTRNPPLFVVSKHQNRPTSHLDPRTSGHLVEPEGSPALVSSARAHFGSDCTLDPQDGPDSTVRSRPLFSRSPPARSLSGLGIEDVFKDSDDPDTVYPYHPLIQKKKKKNVVPKAPDFKRHKKPLFEACLRSGKMTQFEGFPMSECLMDVVRHWPKGFLDKSFNASYVQKAKKPKRKELGDELEDELLDAWHLLLNHLGFMADKEKKSKDGLHTAYAECMLQRFGAKDRSKCQDKLVAFLTTLGVPPPQGCIGREGTSEAVLEKGGWRGLPKRLWAVTVGYKCHEAGTCRQEDSGWA